MAYPQTGSRPSRRPQISREYLDAHRRLRFVDAVAELLHEFGRDGVSVTNIVRLAGSARGSFYEVFRSADDCIAYAAALAVEELFTVLDDQDGDGEWSNEVQLAIAGFYESVVAWPLLAELLLIHAAACKIEPGREAAREGAERFMPLLLRGRAVAEARGRGGPAPSAEEFFSRSVVSLAARWVRTPALEKLPAEATAVAALATAAYLGSEETASAVMSA